MTDPIRIGIVGLGWWGGELARAVAATSGAALVSCHARTAATRTAFAVAHGCRAASTLEEMLTDDEVDAVLLATPHSVHVEQICLAAEHGKHVFVDKPLSLTAAAARDAVAAVQRAGLVLQVGHNRRRQAPNRRIRQMLDAGELGMVHFVDGVITVPKDQAPRPGWRGDPAECPVGGMTALGVHMIDTFRYLAGPIQRVNVASKQLWGVGRLDDITSVQMEFARGALGHLTCSMVLPRTASVTVMGTGGIAWNTEDGRRLHLQRTDEQAPQEIAVEEVDTLADQLAEFVQCVATGAQPETDGVQGLEVVAVLEAIVASARDRAPRLVEDFRQP